ncbi:MAG TPA: hypothetical protein VF365_02655 [Candidatus Limnocylindria bacterium]
MKRFAILGIIAAVWLAVPASAFAAPPNIHHSIKVTMASAYFVRQDDCIKTEAWISAVDGQWASQGGGVTTSGDLAVSLRVVDTCDSTAAGGIRPMAGGEGGTVLYDGLGRAPVPLQSSPRIDAAWSSAMVEMVDQLNGGTTPVWASVSWTGGDLSHETTPNNHGKCAGGECLPWMEDFDVVVNTHDNNLRRDAVATIELIVDGMPIAFEPSAEGSIEQVKSSCMEIPKGTFSGDSDYCF